MPNTRRASSIKNQKVTHWFSCTKNEENWALRDQGNLNEKVLVTVPGNQYRRRPTKCIWLSNTTLSMIPLTTQSRYSRRYHRTSCSPWWLNRVEVQTPPVPSSSQTQQCDQLNKSVQLRWKFVSNSKSWYCLQEGMSCTLGYRVASNIVEKPELSKSSSFQNYPKMSIFKRKYNF